MTEQNKTHNKPKRSSERANLVGTRHTHVHQPGRAADEDDPVFGGLRKVGLDQGAGHVSSNAVPLTFRGVVHLRPVSPRKQMESGEEGGGWGGVHSGQ